MRDTSPECDTIQDDARTEAAESALSVLVRDGWRQPGERTEEGADEYEVLLTTGGREIKS